MTPEEVSKLKPEDEVEVWWEGKWYKALVVGPDPRRVDATVCVQEDGGAWLIGPEGRQYAVFAPSLIRLPARTNQEIAEAYAEKWLTSLRSSVARALCPSLADLIPAALDEAARR